MPDVPTKEQVEFTQGLVDRCLLLLRELCDVELRSYQIEIVDRVLFSLIIGDGEEITVEASRQAGKTEALSCLVATAMVVLPLLAKIFPENEDLQKFKRGVMIGVFAPVDFQAETLFSRIASHIDSEHSKDFLRDPDFQDEPIISGNIIMLKRNRSFCRKQTAFPKAKIESTTYHLIIIDEAQDADSETVRRRIHPMMTAVNGTIVKIGTPTTHISDFYEAIRRNRHRRPRYGKKYHFAYTWRRAAKESRDYAKAIAKEKRRLGEDSDEFRMSYELVWMLDRGMFITEEQIEELGDRQMPIIPFYYDTPIVMGIDVARKHDSTVCTALWVDWDNQDEFGLYPHRILSWLELHGEEWEVQYEQIVNYARNYNVMRVGVDAQGMGGPAAERLQRMMPNVEVIGMPMDPRAQTERWRHLMQLIQRKMIGWPANPDARRLVTYQRFKQQMLNVEKEYKGVQIVVAAPKNEKNAHDDYLDSLALACSLTRDFNGQDQTIEQWDTNPFFSDRGVRSGGLARA